MNFGPPISLEGGGKMSNTLDMGSAGFASGGFAFFGPPRSEGVVFSVDGVTYRKAFNMSVRTNKRKHLLSSHPLFVSSCPSGVDQGLFSSG